MGFDLLFIEKKLIGFLKRVLGTTFPQNPASTLLMLSKIEPQVQCLAINVGFEMYISIESKLSILMIGFDFEMGDLFHFGFDIE